jgi:hypothetical protein
MPLRLTTIALAVSLCAIAATNSTPITFSKDVMPILQKNCQTCHRPGQAAPFSMLTYKDTRPWASAIKEAVVLKKMPPWSADPHYGKFINDRSLAPSEIDTLAKWADAGAPEGNPKDLPKPLQFAEGWLIGKPDVELAMENEFAVPASGEIQYQYIKVPTNFTEDKWVQKLEFRPSNPKVVHHVVLFIREPDNSFMKNIPPGTPMPTKNSALHNPKGEDDGTGKIESAGGPEILGIYVPGGSTQVWKDGQAKLIKAGSDIIFQMHYTANGTATVDRSRVGLIFANAPPSERVKTIFISNRRFTIPAGAPNHEVRARVTLPIDVTVTGYFPHMHVRGKSFEYRVTYPTGEKQVLLSVPRYDFSWQLFYFLDKPVVLPKGTVVECIAHYDNSPNNPTNPDATKDVHWGDQSWEEMLAGFLDVTTPI